MIIDRDFLNDATLLFKPLLKTQTTYGPLVYVKSISSGL